MILDLEKIETVGQRLDEARAKVEITRAESRAALDLQDGEMPQLSQAVARRQWVEAEPDLIEAGIAVREGLA